MPRKILGSEVLYKSLKLSEPALGAPALMLAIGVTWLLVTGTALTWFITKNPGWIYCSVGTGVLGMTLIAGLVLLASRSFHRSLTKSRQALSGMLAIFPCLVTDQNRRILFANQLFKDFFPQIEEKGFEYIVSRLMAPTQKNHFNTVCTKGLQSKSAFSDAQTFILDGGREEEIFVSVLPLSQDGVFLWRFLSINDLKQRFFRQNFSTGRFIKTLNLENLFHCAPAGNVLLDSSCHIHDWNRTFEEAFFKKEGLSHGTPFLTYIDAKDQENVHRMMAKAAASTHAPQDHHCEARLASGKEVVLYASSFNYPSLSTQGAQEKGIFLQIFDNTQAKQIHARVSQSQKTQALGQLAGGIAHDFNNLLTAMIGFCDLLLLRHAPSDPSFMDIMQIKQNANRAANLVRQLLAFSRQQALQPKIVDISEILEDVSLLLQRLIGSTIKLNIFHGRSLGTVRVDRGQLEQVIINLVVNARDALGGDGDITIKTKNVVFEKSTQVFQELIKAGSYVCVEVRDTGVGMARETLERIFDPFFSTKEVGSGTGLGLSTVHGIVSQTGGYVCVDSAPDEGTSFYIYLPHYEGSAAAKEQAQESEKHHAIVNRDLTGSGTILLVEDEDAVRLFSARALRDKGYHVIEATTGEEGLNYLTTAWESGHEKVDLVITDVVMPVMDGPTLVRRAHELFPHLKVIFISGYAEDTFREKLTCEEEIIFLPKPYTLKDLASIVKQTLGVKQKVRRLAKVS
ncbi:MAG: PAS domain-containing sensor histidine kinase [Candidatus Puniceispirillum sp.]|nr:PAS domain-containing sensor histidine kinase [Candidatus Puniceispirillum sp.]